MGHQLDRDLAAFLALPSDDSRGWHELSVTEARQRCRDEAPVCAGPGDQTVTARDGVADTGGGQVRIRAYRPPGAGGELPLVVYIHGGGFVLGDLDTHDAVCRDLVAAGGFCLLALDYGLSPEHRFPAALAQCAAVLDWARRHARDLGADPARIAVAGDSAGGISPPPPACGSGTRGLPLPRFQLLVYPVTDLTMGCASIHQAPQHYGLSAADLGWFYAHYTGPGGDPRDPCASVIFAGLARPAAGSCHHGGARSAARRGRGLCPRPRERRRAGDGAALSRPGPRHLRNVRRGARRAHPPAGRGERTQPGSQCHLSPPCPVIPRARDGPDRVGD